MHSLPGEFGEIVVEIVGETEHLPTIGAVRDFVVEPMTVGEVLLHEGTAITTSGIRSSSIKKKPFAHVTKLITTIKYSVSHASTADEAQLPAIPQQPALRFVRDLRRAIHIRCSNETLLFVGRGGYTAYPGKLFLSDWIDLSDRGILSGGFFVLYRTGDKQEEGVAADIQASLEGSVDSIVVSDPVYRKRIIERVPPGVDIWGVKGMSSKGSRFDVYL